MKPRSDRLKKSSSRFTSGKLPHSCSTLAAAVLKRSFDAEQPRGIDPENTRFVVVGFDMRTGKQQQFQYARHSGIDVGEGYFAGAKFMADR